MAIECECKTWATDMKPDQIWFSHNPNCPHYDPQAELKELLYKLVEGVEQWAREEDGVHPDCWEAYVSACLILGRPVQTDEDIVEAHS